MGRMSRRKRQSMIAGIMALLGVILILSVVWVVSREHRFKGYRNKDKGFSMSYPANWSFREDVEGTVVVFFSPKENDLDFFKENVNVVVQDISAKPMTLKKYSETAIRQMEVVFEENFVVLESGSTRIADQPGYKLIFLGKGPDVELQYMCVWTIKELKAYQITYTSLSFQYERYLPKMKRMIKSFHLE